MSQACRVGDETSGICDVGEPDCCPHGRSGTNSGGSGNVYINSRQAHRNGDSISIICPHGGSGSSEEGSRTVFVNGRSLTRNGDATVCNACGMGGNHISGSPNVFIGT